MDALRKVLEEVLNFIKPRLEDYQYLSVLSDLVSKNVRWCLEEEGLPYLEVSAQGSFAKDTFLRNDVDIDLFVLFDKGVKPEELELKFVPSIKRCLEARGFRTVIKYATHPYVTVVVGNVEIDVVPAYYVSDPREIITAVDRTPFHTAYITSKLSEKEKDEVRLLKAFMKGVGVYGAEVRVRGFSGYLAELLIVRYGSFLSVLRESENWKPYKTCIDIEGYYSNERDCLKRFRGAPLVVVDPVDPRRNAAASVSIRSLSLFRLCAKLFLECPSTRFFLRPNVVLDEKRLDEVVSEVKRECFESLRGMFLVVHRVLRVSEDVVWGQLRRFERAIVNVLRSSRLRVLSIDSYLDSDSLRAYTFVEVYLGSVKKHLHEGPPATELANAVKFIKKNIRAEVPPWIDTENRLLCIKALNVEDVIQKHVRAIELEFVKPLEIVNLCKEPEHLKKVPMDVLTWIHSSIKKNFFYYLLEPCIENSLRFNRDIG